MRRGSFLRCTRLIAVPVDPRNAHTVSTAHHQAQVAQASIRKETPMPQPAQAPQLVVSLRCGQRRDDGRWVIRFVKEEPDGERVGELVFDIPEAKR